jgi:argininosuccinate lyase
MRAAAGDPALMATDLAEWLVRQGVPFRTAHHRVGKFVAWCQQHGKPLDGVTLDEMRQTIPEALPEALTLFSPERSVAARDIVGGTAPAQVHRQLAAWRVRLGEG